MMTKARNFLAFFMEYPFSLFLCIARNGNWGKGEGCCGNCMEIARRYLLRHRVTLPLHWKSSWNPRQECHKMKAT